MSCGSGGWEAAAEDLAELRGLDLGSCYFGAGEYDVEPFLCSAPSGEVLRGSDVLRALHARNFASEHIEDLARTEIPAPGYHGYTINDEIHTDPAEQRIFFTPGCDEEDDIPPGPDLDEAQANARVHEALRELVQEPVFYVLLHEDGGEYCPLVALFAVGRSRRGDHLIGVATQQVCHNLCD